MALKRTDGLETGRLRPEAARRIRIGILRAPLGRERGGTHATRLPATIGHRLRQ